jgi:secreted trypsin-like serine protease
MFLPLPVVDDIECLRSKSVFSKITSKSTFCVGDKSGRAPAQGDSGGAFAYKTDGRYYLRGIVSAGAITEDFTTDSYEYVIFTDAALYSDWVNHYISTYG